MSWFSDGSLNRPAFEQSLVENFARHSNTIGPLRCCQSQSGERRIATSARVVSLLFHCRPTTIGRRIWSVIILALKRVFARRWIAHVIKKVFKLEPAFTDTYSPSAVVVVLVMNWIVTPSFHAKPPPVNVCFAQPVSPECAASAWRNSTAFHAFPRQIRSINLPPNTAVAFAPVHPALIFDQASWKIQNGQFTESIAWGDVQHTGSRNT